MAESATLTTLKEILLDSDMLGTIVLGYVYLLMVMLVAFLNIHSFDKYKFLFERDLQTYFIFKRNLPFIVTYSKDKHIIAKKTFALNVVGYCLSFGSIACCICSIAFQVNTAIILLAFWASAILIFGCVTGYLYRKTRI